MISDPLNNMSKHFLNTYTARPQDTRPQGVQTLKIQGFLLDPKHMRYTDRLKMSLKFHTVGVTSQNAVLSCTVKALLYIVKRSF